MSDLEERLHSWLSEQGYPLEMLVARAFGKLGAFVMQSNYYIDYETNKAREIDVSAKWYKHYETRDNLAELEIFYFVECKSRQKHPWLIFSTGTSSKQPFMYPPASQDGRRLLGYMAAAEKSDLPELLKLRERAGYGLAEGFSTGRDTPYEAVMSAVKASVAEIIASDALHDELQYDEDKIVDGLHFRPLIAHSIVVTDSPLFECYLDETNSLVLRPIEYGAVEWKYPTGRRSGYESIAVYIYNSSAIDHLIAHAQELNEALIRHLPSQTDELIARANKKDETA